MTTSTIVHAIHHAVAMAVDSSLALIVVGLLATFLVLSAGGRR